MNTETIKSYLYLGKWLFIALVAGVVGTLIVHSFFDLLRIGAAFIENGVIPQPAWPLAGAVAVCGGLYALAPLAAREGLPSYIETNEVHNGRFPLAASAVKYAAALITLATHGSGGVVGPMGRCVSGVTSWLVGQCTRLRRVFQEGDIHTASLCGMAAAVGTIFHSPIGGGVFAVELVGKHKMGYRELFPAIMSSSTAVLLAKVLGRQSFYTFNVPNEFMQAGFVGWLLLCAVLSGALGALYEKMYMWTSRLFRRSRGRLFYKGIIGMALAFTIAYLVNPGLFGTSRRFIPALIRGDFTVFTVAGTAVMPLAVTLVVLLLCKLLTNCIVVGSGMSAGFTGPAIIAGMMLGAAFALLVGVETGSATYYAFICAGFTGMLAGSMNIPIAAAIMGIEIFGLDYSFAAGLASVVAFQMSRGTTIYSDTTR